jgi:hypothetical protein
VIRKSMIQQGLWMKLNYRIVLYKFQPQVERSTIVKIYQSMAMQETDTYNNSFSADKKQDY